MTPKQQRQLLQLVGLERALEKDLQVTNSLIRTALGIPLGKGYPHFNQGLYELINAKYVSREKITPIVSYYKLTAKGKKFINANSEMVVALDAATLFPYKPPVPNENASAPQAPEPVMSRTQDLAITGIAQLIEENKQMRGLFARFHAEIGRLLNDTNPEKPEE